MKTTYHHEITYHLKKSREWFAESLYLRFTRYANKSTSWCLLEQGGLGRPLELKWSTGRSKVKKYFKEYPFKAQITVETNIIRDILNG